MEGNIDLEYERKETMALIGLVGGLILCGLLIAGLKTAKHANGTTKVNNVKLF